MRPLSKNMAKRAGVILRDINAPEDKVKEANAIVSDWREAHQEILDFYHDLLKTTALSLDSDALCVSRLKRYDTIIGKLKRPGLHMNLNQMHDIAGCRAIVGDNDCVFAVKDCLEAALKNSCIPGIKDYIHQPKKNGSRSLHLICQHDSSLTGLKDLYCEIQIRTRLQHEWATALETYDVVCGSGLKFDKGSLDEARIFALISNVLAIKENAALVPCVSADLNELRSEIIELDNKLKLLDRLAACSGSVSVVATSGNFSDNAYCLMCVDYGEQKTDLFIYDDYEDLRTNELYTRQEEMKKDLQDVLLVKVSSLKGLQEAYPSYSMDIKGFLNTVNEFLGR